MSVRAGDTVEQRFYVRNDENTLVNADALPVGTLFRGADATAVPVTIANRDTGVYSFSFDIPGDATTGQRYSLLVAVTVNGTADQDILWHDTVVNEVTVGGYVPGASPADALEAHDPATADDVAALLAELKGAGWDGSANSLKALRDAVDAKLNASAYTDPPSVSSIATGVWSAEARSLTDKAGFALTSDYDAAKTAAQAGDAMTLTAGERLNLAAALEAAIIDDLDGTAVMEAIANLISSEMDGSGLSVETIAAAVRDTVFNRILAGNHDVEGSAGKLLQRLDAAVSSRATAASVNALNSAVQDRTLPAAQYATADEVEALESLLTALQGADFDAAAHSLVKIADLLGRKLDASDYTAPPSVQAIRTELDTNSAKLANLDAPVSSRATPDDVNVEVEVEGGIALDALQSELGVLKGAGFDPETDTLVKIREEASAASAKLAKVDAIHAKLPEGSMVSDTVLTPQRAAKLDNLDVSVGSRATDAGVWGHGDRTLTGPVTVGDYEEGRSPSDALAGSNLVTKAELDALGNALKGGGWTGQSLKSLADLVENAATSAELSTYIQALAGPGFQPDAASLQKIREALLSLEQGTLTPEALREELGVLQGEGWNNETLKHIAGVAENVLELVQAGGGGGGGSVPGSPVYGGGLPAGGSPATVPVTKGSWSNFLRNKVLDHVLGGHLYVVPDTLYLGLWTVLLHEDSTGYSGGEVMGEGYARLPVPNTTAQFPLTSTQEKANAAVLEFPAAQGEWGTVRSFAVLDAPEGGNVLFFGELVTPRKVTAGQGIRFSPSALRIKARHDS